MTDVRAEDNESMLPLAPVGDASEEIQNLLRYGRIAKLEDWTLMNIRPGQRGPFLAGTISGKAGMYTSRLVLFQPDLGYAVTKNTIYILGKERLIIAGHLLGNEKDPGGSFGKEALGVGI